MLAVILFVNLLIAMFSDSYTKIAEQSNEQYQMFRVVKVKTYMSQFAVPPPFNMPILLYLILRSFVSGRSHAMEGGENGRNDDAARDSSSSSSSGDNTPRSGGMFRFLRGKSGGNRVGPEPSAPRKKKPNPVFTEAQAEAAEKAAREKMLDLREKAQEREVQQMLERIEHEVLHATAEHRKKTDGMLKTIENEVKQLAARVDECASTSSAVEGGVGGGNRRRGGRPMANTLGPASAPRPGHQRTAELAAAVRPVDPPARDVHLGAKPLDASGRRVQPPTRLLPLPNPVPLRPPSEATDAGPPPEHRPAPSLPHSSTPGAPTPPEAAAGGADGARASEDSEASAQYEQARMEADAARRDEAAFADAARRASEVAAEASRREADAHADLLASAPDSGLPPLPERPAPTSRQGTRVQFAPDMSEGTRATAPAPDLPGGSGGAGGGAAAPPTQPQDGRSAVDSRVEEILRGLH